MKIILKYILTNVKERKTRTVVMLLSIILSTVLLFVSFSIGASYENAQRKMARGMAGTATVLVRSINNSDMIDLNDIPDLPDIAEKVGILEGRALYHEQGYYETVDLIAADISLLSKINKPRLVSGGEINNFDGNKIILPDRFTTKYGIKKGDKITLQINGVPVKFEVYEIAAYDTVFLRRTRGATALLPKDTLAKILGESNGYNQILIKPVKGITTSEMINILSDKLATGDMEISEIVNESQIIADARQKSMPFFLISFFSLTMSIFIIYSSYKVITLDRLPVIGAFRSIGATQKVVTRILLIESAFYGCSGGIIGILLGVIVLKFILQGMGSSLVQGIKITAVISPMGVFLSLAVAVIVSLLSAWLPIHQASRLPIKNVILGGVEEKQVSNRLIMGIGVSLFVISAILPNLVSGKSLYIAGGFSLLGLIIATILVIPFITNVMSKVLVKIYSFVFHNEGMLAARNMRDNKNITQNITLLFISISAVIAIAVIVNFVNTYITDVFNGAEIQGFADGEMNQEFIEQVKGMEGIEKVLPIYVFNNEIKMGNVTFSRVEATDNLEWYNSMLNLNYKEKDEESNLTSDFSKTRSIVLNKDFLSRMGIVVGDTLNLSNGNDQYSYKVVGSFETRATDVDAIIPSKYAVSDFNAKNYNFLAYTAVDPSAIMVQIRDLFGDTQNWSRTIEEFNIDALSTVGAFLQPVHNLTYFILLLATVGIINNLLINYMQKRRSIAMYKSVGLSNWQNVKITLIESFTSGMIGAFIAVAVSYIEIRTIFIVAGPKISMTPKLDIMTFVVSGAMGVLVTLIGSIVPIVKSRKMKLVEEIKFE